MYLYFIIPFRKRVPFFYACYKTFCLPKSKRMRMDLNKICQFKNPSSKAENVNYSFSDYCIEIIYILWYILIQ